MLECAAICEYGFKVDSDGCPTCTCDDACEGYKCLENEECVILKESTCIYSYCPTLPICKYFFYNPSSSINYDIEMIIQIFLSFDLNFLPHIDLDFLS